MITREVLLIVKNSEISANKEGSSYEFSRYITVSYHYIFQHDYDIAECIFNMATYVFRLLNKK